MDDDDTGRRGARDDDDDDDDRRFEFVRFGQKTRLSSFLQWMITVSPPTSYSFLRSSLPLLLTLPTLLPVARSLSPALCVALSNPPCWRFFWLKIWSEKSSKENWGPVRVNFLLVERESLEKINLAEITSMVLWRKLVAATMSAK